MKIECVGLDGGDEPTMKPTEVQDFTKVEFEMNGVRGQEIEEECGQYREWRHSLDATAPYTQIEMMSRSGGGDPFICDDEEMATSICQAIAKGETFSAMECNGHYWSTGSCGQSDINSELIGSSVGYEVKVTEGNYHTICRCDNSDETAIMRPCLGNQNWGGFRQATCNASTQDVVISCTMGVVSKPTSFEMNGERGVTIKEECQEYREWRSTLDPEGQYTFVQVAQKINGVLQDNNDFLCSDPEKATAVCRAIAKGETFSGAECGGAYWSSGSCGSDTTGSELVGTNTGYEVKVTETNYHTICRCDNNSQTAIFRPCLGNQNWGGFRGPTCNGSTQDMIITCGQGNVVTEPTPEPTKLPDGFEVVRFEMNGVQGETISEECGEYRTWRSSLEEDAQYSMVKMYSPAGGEPFMCDDADMATQICQGIAGERTFSAMECNG